MAFFPILPVDHGSAGTDLRLEKNSPGGGADQHIRPSDLIQIN
jgi:hypothetical protein